MKLQSSINNIQFHKTNTERHGSSPAEYHLIEGEEESSICYG